MDNLEKLIGVKYIMGTQEDSAAFSTQTTPNLELLRFALDDLTRQRRQQAVGIHEDWPCGARTHQHVLLRARSSHGCLVFVLFVYKQGDSWRRVQVRESVNTYCRAGRSSQVFSLARVNKYCCA